MIIIGKSATDELYYVTVNGTTEILSRDAAFGILLNLQTLLGVDDIDLMSTAPGSDRTQ